MWILYSVIAFIIYINLKSRSDKFEIPPSLISIFWLPALGYMLVVGLLFYLPRMLFKARKITKSYSFEGTPTKLEEACLRDIESLIVAYQGNVQYSDYLYHATEILRDYDEASLKILISTFNKVKFIDEEYALETQKALRDLLIKC